MGEFSKRDVKRILKANGWILHHIKGSHAVYRNNKNQHLTVTINGCNRMIMQRLIKEYGLKVN